jgi:hypothetical protein
MTLKAQTLIRAGMMILCKMNNLKNHFFFKDKNVKKPLKSYQDNKLMSILVIVLKDQ